MDYNQSIFNESSLNIWNMTRNETQFRCKDDGERTEFEIRFGFFMNGIVLNLVGIVGILGNIVSMIILSRPHMRSSINYLLIGLARSDTILIVTSMLLFGLRSVYPYTGYMVFYYYYIYPHIAIIIFPLATAAQTATAYLTLLVSLERYVAVCHPLRARALCTYGRSKYYVLFCAIFAILYNLVKLLEVDIVMEDIPTLGPVYCVVSSNLRKNDLFKTYYVHWGYLVVNYLIPFAGLLVFNVLIYLQVRKANRERQRLSRSERREIGLATMLMCVVVMFCLSNVLALILNMQEAFFTKKLNQNFITISDLLITLNSSVNFIIYVIFGEKFQRIFLMLFCKSRSRQEGPDGLMNDDNSSFSNGHSRNNSTRFSRHGTRGSRNATECTTITHVGTSKKSLRAVQVHSPTSTSCVYYPVSEIGPANNSYD